MRSTCSECTSTSSECMWCSNMKQCVDSNAYVASFPFGQCMEWYTMNTCPRKLRPIAIALPTRERLSLSNAHFPCSEVSNLHLRKLVKMWPLLNEMGINNLL